MADAGLRRVVPSDLYPLVLGFLRDNQLSEVANKFAKATGAVSAGLGQGLGWDDHRSLGPDRFRFLPVEVSRVRQSTICGAFVPSSRRWPESLESRHLVPHEVSLDSVESCCFFLLSVAVTAAWDPRGPGHVAGGVRRGGSVGSHRRHWRLLVPS